MKRLMEYESFPLHFCVATNIGWKKTLTESTMLTLEPCFLKYGYHGDRFNINSAFLAQVQEACDRSSVLCTTNLTSPSAFQDLSLYYR